MNGQAAAPLESSTTFRQTIAPALGLVLVVIIVFSPTVGGDFLLDDEVYVATNPTLRSAGGLVRIWLEPGSTPQYYPLVFSSFWVEYHLWGLSPAGYHVVNILVHGLSAVLLWCILRVLGVPGGWFAAALFAVHPVQVESVGWIQERKNVLSGLFYFSAALAYLHYALDDPADAQSARTGDALSHPVMARRGWYVVALAAGVCAFLTKTTTCSLPAALALVLWWKRDRLRGRDWLALLPLFVLAIAAAFMTVWMEKKLYTGEEDFPLSLSWIERCLVAGRALWFYAGKLVWPARLALIYPRWQMDAAVWWQYLFPLAALGAVAALWLWRGKIGKGPLVAILFFAGSLLPTLGFVSFYNMRHTFVADHFVYLACVGLVVLAAAVMCRALARWNVQPAWRASAAAALLIILGITTFQQGLLFVNPENLWTETLEENPGSWLAHYHLATTLETKGEYHQAADHLRDALRIKPDYSFAHFQLGNLLAREGKIEEAKEHLREVIRLAPEGDHNARGILGTLLARQGRLDEAADCLTAELEFHPDAALMHYNLALVRAQQKKWAEACNSLRQACAFASEVSKYHYALADVLRHLGRFDEASEEVNRAQRLERRGR